MLEFILESTAIFMLSDSKYDKWVDKKWELIKKYMNGEITLTYPCMYGIFYINGVRYVCDHSGIRKA